MLLLHAVNLMKYQKQFSVICLADPKQSALYFDRILPISYLSQNCSLPTDQKLKIFCELSGVDPNDKYDEFHELLDGLQRVDDVITNIIEKIRITWIKLSEITDGKIDEKDVDKELKSLDKITDRHGPELFDFFHDFFTAAFMKRGYFSKSDFYTATLSFAYVYDITFSDSHLSIRNLFVRLSSLFSVDRLPILFPSEFNLKYHPTKEDITLSIDNVPLVDTTCASWDQILEFRKDKEARKKLRNLRLFLHENYAGKNRAFIEDDLSKRLDEYENTRKDHGFESLTSTISAVMDSKSVQASIAASIVSAYFGEPIVTTGAALPAVMEIGNMTIEYIKNKHAFHKLKRDHDLAYIIEAKERFKNNS